MFFHYPSYYTIPMTEDDIYTSQEKYRLENEADEIEDYVTDMFSKVDSEYVQEVTSSNI